MTLSSIKQKLEEHVNGDLFRIMVRLSQILYVCFHEGQLLHLYRVEGNLITYHAREVSPDLDCDVVENFCLQIEEQYAADSTVEGGTSG